MRLLFRIDDACPTMDRYKWNAIEDIFDTYGIKPIVAVIPKCRDPKLVFNDPDRNFWRRVESWVNKGWTIAQHGYMHLYHEVDRKKNLIPIHNFSEFTGLSYEEQFFKISEGYKIFKEKGIPVDLFIAPAHAFDVNTLEALKKVGISIISDGYAKDVFFEYGVFWIPQIMGHISVRAIKLLKLLNFKLIAICLHPNKMELDEIRDLEIFLSSNRERVVEFTDIKLFNRRKTIIEKLFEKIYMLKYRLMRNAR